MGEGLIPALERYRSVALQTVVFEMMKEAA